MDSAGGGGGGGSVSALALREADRSPPALHKSWRRADVEGMLAPSFPRQRWRNQAVGTAPT